MTLTPPQRAPAKAAGSATASPAVSPDQAKASIEWLTELALRRLPDRYTGEKNWGHQKKIWSGVKLRFDQGKLRTKRRQREINQGRWIQYEIEIPKNQTIQSTIDRVESLPTQERFAGGGVRVKSTTRTPMKFSARMQRWNLGIRLYSVTIEGRMEVQLKAQTVLGIHADYGEVPPAIVVNPIIENTDLKLVRFEVDRVSHIGGDAAEAWGEVLQEAIVERFVAKQGDRLTERLNRSIEKHRDDLHLSPASWLEGWQ